MELLYRGFDGLDVSFQARLPRDLCSELESAKAAAQERHCDVLLVWNDVRLRVSESGARGGYAFRASTGEFGETWFFKRPNTRDPWGARASSSSFQLAMNGLAKTFANLVETLHRLGIRTRDGEESIGRVDYCLDFLAPDFELDPACFVMHSNSSRADHRECVEFGTNGTSGRITSVTVGKMPNRQVIVYDKTAEIISHNKPAWWVIWDATRERCGQPPLSPAGPDKSRVWRAELRAGKRFLKDRWAITSWADLGSRFGDLIAATVASVRHTTPSLDSNRSRWPTSTMWDAVARETNDDLFEMRNYADPDLVKAVQRDAFCNMLQRQMDGIAITQAAVRGVPFTEVPDFVVHEGQRMAQRFMQESDRLKAKYLNAAARYAVSDERS